MTTHFSSGIIVKPQILFAPSKFNFETPYFSLSKSISVSRSLKVAAATPMASEQSSVAAATSVPDSYIKLLFVEMGVGYDQHGQDITKAAMRACRDAITSNSIPAFRKGSIPGVSFGEMKLQIKLESLSLSSICWISISGAITNVEVVDGYARVACLLKKWEIRMKSATS